MWETNFEGSLSKSKSESDLRDTELNPSRLDSYMFDSLWKNLQNSGGTGVRNHVTQNF